MTDEPAWTMGVEEEYLLVDRETGALITKQPPGLLEEVANVRHGLVARELFSSQIEIGTGVCANVKELRADIWVLRQAVAEAAAEHGMAPIATSTHPFARWLSQQYTEAERYRALTADLQAVSRQLLISGMHVHVGIEDPDLRIDLMDQVAYFLPHLLALSTSSPFWEGRDTGLKCYRLTVAEALPRTGFPEKFSSWSDFKRHVDVLVGAGIIKDSTMVWWHIRPSERYPTVEMRVTDLPTRMEDTIALAAMYVCLLRMLWRLRLENPPLAELRQLPAVGEPVASGALRDQRRAHGLRQGRAGALRRPAGGAHRDGHARRRGPGLRDGDRAHPHDLPARAPPRTASSPCTAGRSTRAPPRTRPSRRSSTR